MFKWNKVPFLRLFIPLALGIATAMKINSVWMFPFIFLLILFILTSIVLIFTNTLLKRNKTWVAGLILSAFLFVSGYNIYISANSFRNDTTYYGNNLSDADLYRVRIIEPLTVKENSTKAIIKVDASNIKGKWHPTFGKGIIFFEKDSISNNLNYGDELIINSKLNEVKAPQNPNEFNYKAFLANRYIYYQAYVKKNQFKRTEEGKGNLITAFASNLRKYFLMIFEDNNMTGREYAVISAILLGQTDHIDSELFKEYQGSGAVHVLVVAGLHVGIILLMLNFLLGFLDRFNNGKYIKTSIILIVIWFYALMTGLSPPVFRAAIMITFVSIGRNNRRSLNSINILLASAFFVLIFNPNLLADVGFQLSYMAVAGILLLQKPVASIWHPKQFLINKLWQVTALSIAAQLFTLPLTLLYFHQFPNLFLITNLVVFFFASAIILMGIVVLITSFIPVISIFLTKVLVWLIFGMNSSIHFIETFPNAVTRSIAFNSLNTILLYLLILFLLLFVFMKIKRMLFPAFIIIILMLLVSAFTDYQYLTQKKLFVYDINKMTVINIINGKQCTILADSIVFADKDKYNAHLENNYTQMGIKNFTYEIFYHYNKENKASNLHTDYFIQLNSSRIAIIDKPVSKLYDGIRLKIDFLIISHNARLHIKDLIKLYDAGMIIFDSSNYLAQTLKWSKECVSLNQNYYNVLKNGAYENDF